MALKQIIDETRAAVAEDPEAGQVDFETVSELAGLVEVDVQIGDHRVKADEPEELGGGGVAPNPVEHALASLGSCQAITYRYWAEKLEIRIDHVRVRVTGDLDLQGFFGFDRSVRAGFEDVRVEVDVSGPEEPESYEQLFEAVNEHCPVLDIFQNSVPVKTSLRTAGAAAGTAAGS